MLAYLLPSPTNFPPAFHCLLHSHFVGVLDVAAHGNAGGDAGDANPGRFEQARQIDGRGFAFERGIGGDDNLVGAVVFQAVHEVGNAQVLGANAVNGRKRAMQNMVDAAVIAGFFDSGNVGWFLDHANEALVAGRA